MKAITIADIKAFIDKTEIPYNASQKKLCVPIINRMCQKMAHGIKFDDIKIYEDLVIDGHHRYLSSLMSDVGINSVSSNKTSATISVKWSDVEFDEEDWDTKSKILHLNELDAKYNGMNIDFLRQLTGE